jgi:hypothetical protein
MLCWPVSGERGLVGSHPGSHRSFRRGGQNPERQDQRYRKHGRARNRRIGRHWRRTVTQLRTPTSAFKWIGTDELSRQEVPAARPFERLTLVIRIGGLRLQGLFCGAFEHDTIVTVFLRVPEGQIRVGHFHIFCVHSQETSD